MTSTLRIQLLGDFLLVLDETPMTAVQHLRLQALLAYLLLHRDAPQDRSHLAFLFWPDSTEAQAHTNLRKLLYQLRQSLPEIEPFLLIDNRSLQWLPAGPERAWTLDLLTLEQALARAAEAEQARDTSALRQSLEQAVELYRGELLPGCYDEWLLPERDHWHELFLQAARRLCALLEQERDFDAAITIAQRLLRHDTLHETTYRQLMRLYALRGDRAAALRVYHTCATTLERELGAEPSEATRAAYEMLLQTEKTTTTPTGPLSERGTTAPLLGRQAEWRQMQEAWRKASAGQPRIVLLTGEAGIGKTRLAEEMEAWVGRQGMSTASARCYATLGELAYAPLTAWLRSETLQSTLASLDSAWLSEIARLLPEILTKRPKLPRPLPLTENLQTLQFFEALAGAVLAVRQPLLLVLDDMQWCDRETLEWLHYLIRFESGARLLLIGTVRSEETRPDHPLVAFLSTLQRDGLVTEIVPGQLTAAETTTLAEHILGRELDPTHSATLYAETEGNPLFVVEMARAGTVTAACPTPAKASHPLPLLTQPASTLPPVLQSVLAARLAQLSPLAQEIANVAAAIGREFTFAILARTSGEPEESVVRGLDELWQRRMVREQGGSLVETYDFSHDRLREQIYASLSPAHRRLLHRHIAEAFKTVYAPNLAAISGQIAAHYERAGQPVQAIPYYQQAGEVARQIYANLEAIRVFERAAALLTSSAPGQMGQDVTRQKMARIQETIGDISLDIGRYQEARQAYQAARMLLPEQEYLRQGRLLWKSAKAWNYVSNNPYDAFHASAREDFQQAEQLLASSADPANPAWLQEWIDLHTSQIWPLRGTADDMTAAIEKMRPAIEQYGTEAQHKLLADAIGMRDSVRSRFGFSEEALTERRKALAELLPGGDKGQIGVAHMALGILLIFAGHFDEAEEHLREALHISEQAGIAWMQTRCLTFLPLVFRKRGQVAQVRELLDRAQAIGADQHNNVLQGHRAWVAWRDGNLAEAECAGQAAIAHNPQQPDVNPFQWIGTWPLLGVALAQGKSAAAVEFARLLLAPTQQPQPAPLKALLEAALLAWNAGQPEKAHEMLQQAVPIAREMGYL